jgi:hypothetical protein
MVVMTIFVTLFIVAGDMIINGLKSTRFESEQATAVQNARQSMGIMTEEIRGANTSERGDYPLAVAQPQQLTFFNDVNNDNLMEKIRYYLNNTNLVREVYSPGALKDYSVFSASSTIASYINNGSAPIFTYFNAGSATTTVIDQIRMVRTHVIINVNPATAPNDYILESDVNLRNLKDY